MPPAKLAYRSRCRFHISLIWLEFNCESISSAARFWSLSLSEDNVRSSVTTGDSEASSSPSLSLLSFSDSSTSPHWCPGEKGPSQFWQFSSLLWRGGREPFRDLEDSPLDTPGISQSRMKNHDWKCPTGCDMRSHQGSQYLRVTLDTPGINQARL